MICSVIQPTRIVDGRRVRSRLWYGRLRLEKGGKVETIPLGVTDKRVAQQKLNAIVKERQLVAAGLAVSDSQRSALRRPLSELVEEFLADLTAKGRAHGTVKRYRNLLRTLWRGTRWTHLADVNTSAFISWRASARLKPHYANDILGAAQTFLNWLDRQGVSGFKTLRNIGKVLNTGVGEYRRALSKEEVRRLLAAAPASRAWVYLVIVYTGLRRFELNRLNWGHFHLDAAEPFVELQAKNTKGKRAACLPLRPEVVDALRARRDEATMPFEWVFRGKVPTPAKLRKDLQGAGISERDERGRRVDVHALRKTFCMLLRLSGVPLDRAKELMRHSDLRLTLEVYSDAAQIPLVPEVQKLPAFSLPSAATAARGQALPLHGNLAGGLPPCGSAEPRKVDMQVPKVRPTSDAQIHSQIHSQTAVGAGLGMSPAVAEWVRLVRQQAVDIGLISPAEAASVATGDTRKMVGAVRFELQKGESQRVDSQDVNNTSGPSTHK